MSDDEVERHILTASLDGRWSGQTRWLLRHFGTDRLELNEAWAQTWTRWDCPCCYRSKPFLARLTENNILLCQLDLHHDHIAEEVKSVWRDHRQNNLPDEIDATRRRAFASVYPLVERFAPTLVCNDCNAADAAMKAAIGASVPRNFSFTPREIRKFIIVRPNAPHDLDVEAGLEVWEYVCEDYFERLEFAAMMVGRICAGSHDRELVRPGLNTSRDNMRMLHRLAYEQLSVRDRPGDMAEALRARSLSTAGKASRTRRANRMKVQVPTIEEFREVDAIQSANSLHWRKAGSSWHCAACDRDKFGILRRSNSGRWTAKVMRICDYEEEHEPESRSRRASRVGHDLIFASEKPMTICQDCRQIIIDAAVFVPGMENNCFGIAHLRKLVPTPQKHRRHDVDKTAIVAAIDANAEWRAAVADFCLHRDEAINIDLEHYREMENGQKDAEAAKASLIPRLVANGKLPEHDAEGYFDWFLRERRRISP